MNALNIWTSLILCKKCVATLNNIGLKFNGFQTINRHIIYKHWIVMEVCTRRYKSGIDIIYVEKPTQYFSCLQIVLHLSCDGIPSQTLILPFSCIWENFMEVFILYCAQLTDVHKPLVEKDLPKMLPEYTINLMILIECIHGNQIEQSSRIKYV